MCVYGSVVSGFVCVLVFIFVCRTVCSNTTEVIHLWPSGSYALTATSSYKLDWRNVFYVICAKSMVCVSCVRVFVFLHVFESVHVFWTFPCSTCCRYNLIYSYSVPLKQGSNDAERPTTKCPYRHREELGMKSQDQMSQDRLKEPPLARDTIVPLCNGCRAATQLGPMSFCLSAKCYHC